jgi:hypothetical protein
MSNYRYASNELQAGTYCYERSSPVRRSTRQEDRSRYFEVDLMVYLVGLIPK